MDDDVLKFRVTDHVAEVVFNRPREKNALNIELFSSLVEVGEMISADKGIRAVVLSGAGNCFCAGLDITMFSSELDDLILRTHGVCNLYQKAAWVWHEIPVPVIAAVEGVAFGGGLQIACAADMRYVHPQAKMSIMEIKWGLVPDMAGTQLWRHYVRQDLLRELSYTGEVFSGVEGKEYGFCTKLSEEPVSDALQTARNIATKNPDAIRANKRLLNEQNYLNPLQGLMAESMEQVLIAGGSNLKEAISARLEKRSPQFSSA